MPQCVKNVGRHPIIQTATNWMAIFWALLVTLLYPVIVRPVQYGLCAKYIPQPNPNPHTNTHTQGDE
jgi:hypothetical protein